MSACMIVKWRHIMAQAQARACVYVEVPPPSILPPVAYQNAMFRWEVERRKLAQEAML